MERTPSRMNKAPYLSRTEGIYPQVPVADAQRIVPHFHLPVGSALHMPEKHGENEHRRVYQRKGHVE